MNFKFLTAIALAMPIFAFSANSAATTVKFDAPPSKLNKDVMFAFQNRKSAEKFTEKVVTQKEIGNILWAANGVNRPENAHRTAPSALNQQDVSLYVFDKQNVYLYDAATHSMSLIVKGDHRGLFTERMKTPVIILLVSDVSKFTYGTAENQRMTGAMDAGIVSQNISIYCAGAGIDTRVRASMDKEGLQKLLKLSEKQIPMLNHAVGYEK